MTPTPTKCLFLLAVLLTAASRADEIRVPGGESWNSPFLYRSISFGTPSRSGPPDAMGTSVTGGIFDGIRLNLNRDLVRLAAGLGFNDVTIQTERFTVAKLEALRQWADATGNFRFIKDQGMTLSVWVHEFCELPPDLGKPTLDNEKLWNLQRERYRRLCQLLPEVDFFVLTVVESDVRVTEDPEMLTKLVTIVNEECHKAGKKLIYRTFQWHVEEADVMMRSMNTLPKDVIVMSKCVPQDWHLRGVNDMFIGQTGKRDQYIEFDIAGEYNKLTHVACAFTDVLKRQLDYARKNNCNGFAVRVDRYEASCYGQAQEANLWFLGLYGSGRCDDERKIWGQYSTELFGPKAAPAMIEALYPSGDVVAEAMCVEQESFGYSRDVIPAARNMENPFNVLHSPAKWDKSLQPIYKKIITGDPEIIGRKQAAFDKHLASADQSLRLIDSVKDDLPPGAYPFFRWKLEENRFLLEMFCNMELAWLKDQRMRRTTDPREKEALEAQVQTHLKTFRQLHDSQTDKTLKVTWRGADHSLRRGSCHKWQEWLKRFEDYHRTATGLAAMDTGIATGKPAQCSSEKAGHPSRDANDGDPNTRWCADDNRPGNWWQVDLIKACDLDRIKIIWEYDDRPELYKIEGSANARQWTPLVDRTDHLDVAKQTVHPVSARHIRHIRITMTGSKDSRPASFSEFQVFGHPSSSWSANPTMTRTDLADKIRGGWVGKAYGVSFGAPTEFVNMGKIIDGPLSLQPGALKKLLLHQDDMYVNMALLKAVVDHGLDATPSDFAHQFAFGDFLLWHANGQGRQNLLAGIPPDLSGHPRYNPHADDIDFQIECDFIGLVSPGLPQEAHKICDRAGHLMNWGDGVYGGIFVTAMYAAAFVETNIQKIVESGLASLPAESRYARVVSDVIAWHKKYPGDWKQTWQLLEDKYNHDLCPWGVESKFNIQASLNGAYITLGLLYGDGDLEKTVELSTRCGQDSDCNPANAGGIVGVVLGFNKLPVSVQQALEPYMNSVYNFTSFSIQSATEACVKLALENISRTGGQVDAEKVTIQPQAFKPLRPLEVSFPTMTPVKRYNVNDAGITWSGDWTSSGQDDGAMRHSSRPGDYMETTFEGNIVYVQGDTRFDKGILDIVIDGTYMESRDMFLPKNWSRADQTTAVWITGLADGKHTLRVVVTGRKNNFAAGCQIRLGKVISYRGVVAN